MGVLKKSHAAFDYAVKQSDFPVMRRWNVTKEAAETVADDHLQHLADKKKEATESAARRNKKIIKPDREVVEDADEADAPVVDLLNPFTCPSLSASSCQRNVKPASSSKAKKKAAETPLNQAEFRIF
jgi:hypothetical protein